MSSSTYKPKQNKSNKSPNHEVLGVFLIIVSVFFLLCIIITPIFGAISKAIFNVLLGSFGISAYPILLCLLITGVAMIQHRTVMVSVKTVLAILSIVFFGMILLQLATSHAYLAQTFVEYSKSVYAAKATAGGVVWGTIAYGVQIAVSEIGAYVICSVIIITTTLALTGVFKLLRNRKASVSYTEKQKFTTASVPRTSQTTSQTTPAISNQNAIIQTTPVAVPKRNSLYTGLVERNTHHVSAEVSKTSEIKQEQPRKISSYTDSSLYSAFQSISKTQKEKSPLYEPILPLDDTKTETNVTAYPANPVTKPAPEPQRVVYHSSDSPISNRYVYPEKEPRHTSGYDDIIVGDEFKNEDINRQKTEALRKSRIERVEQTSSNADIAKIPHVETFDERVTKLQPMINRDNTNIDEVKIIVADEFNEPENTKNKPVETTKNTPKNTEWFRPTLFDALSGEKKETTKNEVSANSSTDLGLLSDPRRSQFDTKKEQSNQNQTNTSIEENIIVADNIEKTFTTNENSAKPKEDIKEKTTQDSSLLQVKNDTNSTKANAPKEQPKFTPTKVDNEIDFRNNMITDKEVQGGEFASKDDKVIISDEPAINGAEYVNPPIINGNDFEKQDSKNTSKEIDKEKLKQVSIEEVLSANAIKELAEQKPKPRHEHYDYNRPPLNVLNENEIIIDEEEVARNDAQITASLESELERLGVPVKVKDIQHGPSVTRYEVEIKPGISVKKLTGLAEDIQYYLAGAGLPRIEAPIPGKTAAGIEVPLRNVSVVGLKKVIQSKVFKESQSPITLALGADIAGNIKVCDLEKMPHLLIAGSTGSGKSACLNCIIASLLYKSSPDDVRLILIDPKRVEFSVFKEMPHLLLRDIIVNDTQSINALKWARDEMERRYKLFAKYTTANNINLFNNSLPVKNGTEEKLYRIVIVIDEFADLMTSQKNKEIENLIISLAQKSRAAGIHLILATQRPSADILTGVIKSNLPSRIAFKVASGGDSRIILDSVGAEALVGRGDMLFSSNSDMNMVRIQGAYISMEELTAVVNYVKENNPAYFDEDAIATVFKEEQEVVETTDALNSSQKGNGSSEPTMDVQLERVLAKMIKYNKASTSFIQTHFAFGYNRAARIITQLEKMGYIETPATSSSPRKVIMSADEFFRTFNHTIDEVLSDEQ